MAQLKGFRVNPSFFATLRARVLRHQDNLAEDTAADVRRNLITGGHVETGDLLGSVHARGNQVFIGTDHWWMIEYGARPHFIEVKNKRVMSDRVNIYGTLVNHPGNRAYSPMRRALYTKRRLSRLG